MGFWWILKGYGAKANLIRKLYIIATLLLIQLPNLPIPGRFTLVLVACLLLLYVTKLNYIKDIKKSALLILYVIFISVATPLVYLDEFSWSGSVIFKQIMYCLGFYILFLSGHTIAKFLYRKNEFELLIYTHLLYLILGVAIVFGAYNIVAYLNASPVILDSGRISVTELEPSVATLRPVFIIFITYIIFLYNRKISIVTVYTLIALSLFVLFNIKSKSTIFILPLSILLSTFLVLLTGNGKFINKFLITSSIGFLGVIASYYVLQSEYFIYAYHFTFVDVSGSSLSRLLFAQTGVNLFVSNPFGYGVTYYPFFKQELLNVISVNHFPLNDELLYMQNDGDMSSLFSPKSGFLTWSVNGGVILILTYLWYSFSIIRDCLKTTLDIKIQIAMISSIMYFIFFSMISEINASFVLYFGILTGICRLIIRESNGKLN